MWLVVETSGTLCSTGIYAPATKHWLAYSRIDQADHSSILPSMINEVFDISGVGRKEISALATNLGPGSFTGLRIGLAFLKGFHAVFKPTFLTTTTFKMLFYALPTEKQRGTVHTVIPMHRKKVYLQTFKDRRELDPIVLTIDEAIKLFENTKGLIVASQKTDWIQNLTEFSVEIYNVEASLITKVPELDVIDTSEVMFIEPRYVAEFVPHSGKQG